jgi:hypothetical protein
MKSSALATDLLTFVFRGVVPDYGDTLFLSLHEGDPGTSADQTTNETTYPGYSRVSVARDETAAAFTVTGSDAVNTVTATFPLSTGGPNVLSHWGIGTAAGVMLYSFPLRDASGNPVTSTVNNGSEPRFDGGKITISEA